MSALSAVALAASTLMAQQESRYPTTLQFGTGLINIPVAWVSPNSGDMWISASGKRLSTQAGSSQQDFSASWNTNFSIDTHWWSRASVGFSLYSQNPDWGLFGQLLLHKESARSRLPAVAVGVRNVGPFRHEDRLLVGHDVQLSDTSAPKGFTPDFARGFSTSPTVYGVATKSFSVGKGAGSVSLGFGNGLFSDDGGLGRSYNDKGQIVKGMFFGGRYAFRPSANTTITLLGENDGWDWNAGVAVDWRGLSLGIYGTELEEGGRKSSTRPLADIYNYSKLNLLLGYSGNLRDIVHGTRLRSRVAELEREQQRLRAEIAQRQQQIDTLEASLRSAQAGELAEIARRRQLLETQIQGERESIRRAEERLEQLQENVQPPSPPPAGATPPKR
jgi:hypothetical protein